MACDIAVANGTSETVDPIMQWPLCLNAKGHFGPVLMPKLSTCGWSLTAMELEDKKMTNNDLFTAFIAKYNNRKELYSHCHVFHIYKCLK